MNISKTFPSMLGFYNSLARDLVPKHASGFLAFFSLSLSLTRILIPIVLGIIPIRPPGVCILAFLLGFPA